MGKRNGRWTNLLVLLLLGGVLCLGGMLFTQGMTSTREARFEPVSLHSVLVANYGVDTNPPSLPGVRRLFQRQHIHPLVHSPSHLGPDGRALLQTWQKDRVTPVPYHRRYLKRSAAMTRVPAEAGRNTRSAVDDSTRARDRNYSIDQCSVRKIYIFF